MLNPEHSAPMNENLSIVEADFGSEEHQAAVLQLLQEYAADPLGNGASLPLGSVRHLLPRLRDEPKVITLLAYWDTMPAGIAICYRGFSVENDAPLLIISDFSVRPEFRRRGIGRQILAFIEKLARQLDSPYLTLRVRETNLRALRLYQAAGFSQTPASEDKTGVLCLEKVLG